MTRPYVRAPDDETFRRVYHANQQSIPLTAATLGVSVATVYNCLDRLGIRPRHTNSSKALAERIVALEAQVARIPELEERVHALEARPIAALAVVESHRRIADGGQGARHARRRKAG